VTILKTLLRFASAAPLALRTAITNALPLLLILFLALVLRLLSAWFLMGVIDGEGAEYGRIAENLLNGNGYVGIAIPGTELMFPPLFPLLIAAVSLLTHQTEIAGRLISITMGALIVLPLFYIALHLYGRKVAYIAAALAACHPLLIGFASTVYSETTYMTLVLSGALWSLRCLSLQKPQGFLLAGVFFGLAYLTRPEAVLYPFLTILFIVVTTFVVEQRQVRHAVKASFLLIAAFLILASPNVARLFVETGQFRWEAKSELAYIVARAWVGGQNVEEAAWSIGPNLEEQGAYNRPNIAVIKSTHISFWPAFHIALVDEYRNLNIVEKELSSGTPFGSPLLFGLVILGLFGAPWNRESIAGHLYFVFVILAVPCLSLMAIPYYMDIRYFLLFLPVMIISASNGVVILSRWADATMRLAGSGAVTARKAGMAVGLTSSAALLIVALYGASRVGDLAFYDYKSRPVKEAGQWLRALVPGPKTVMDSSTAIAFEAGASWVYFPYTDGSLALRYIEKKGVNFIVMREDWPAGAPYWKDWLNKGIPDQRARLVYNQRMARGVILIYEWNAGETGQAAGGPAEQ
jgi:4-amino-4-deoxy-L-arabinose transferase-like glycosyltransferase